MFISWLDFPVCVIDSRTVIFYMWSTVGCLAENSEKKGAKITKPALLRYMEGSFSYLAEGI